MRSPRPASRTRPGSPDREAAAARRLAMLAADLGSDAGPPAPAGDEGDRWWTEHTRVVPRPTTPETEEQAPPAAPVLPRPGRHAARRPLLRLTAAAPGIGTAHVAVVAVAVAVALAGTTWWLLRDRAEPLDPVPSAMVSSHPPRTTAPSTPGATSTAAQEDRVTVDVAGKVRRPGIVVLAEGARVVDALEAAGGARKGVDTTGINLARVLVDGEQIVVGRAMAAPGPPTGGTAASGAPADPVNLNLADQAELESLPQVGPVTAAAIIAWRDAHGGFSAVDQLIEVDGIGEKTLQQIAPHATV